MFLFGIVNFVYYIKKKQGYLIDCQPIDFLLKRHKND
mgnify:FL=1|jgi:hypothetical protein